MPAAPQPISEATLGRLSLYLRIADELAHQGTLAVGSLELARRAQVQPFLVRKDLACCGRLGRRGQGYAVRLLQRALSQILHQNRRWTYIIVGMNDLGAALTRYAWPAPYVCAGLFDGPQETAAEQSGPLSTAWHMGARRFELPALPTPTLPAADLSTGYLPPVPRQLSVQPLETLGDFVRQNAVDLAMLSVSPAQAQSAAQAIRAAGIGAILNFTGLPIELHVAAHAHLQEGGHEERDTVIENVDFVQGLHRLSVHTLLTAESTLTEEL